MKIVVLILLPYYYANIVSKSEEDQWRFTDMRGFKGSWREIRATGSSDAASTAGSHAEACQWRSASRRGSELQHIAGNDQPVGSAQPFRGKRGRRVRKGDG
jgi:hypothetical protein